MPALNIVKYSIVLFNPTLSNIAYMSANRKANILMMHDTCKSKVKVEECNCLIMLKDGSSTEYTVGGGEVVAVEHGNITLNKGAAVTLKSFNSKSEGLLEGEEAAKDFVDKRHGGGATLNDV